MAAKRRGSLLPPLPIGAEGADGLDTGTQARGCDVPGGGQRRGDFIIRAGSRAPTETEIRGILKSRTTTGGRKCFDMRHWAWR